MNFTRNLNQNVLIWRDSKLLQLNTDQPVLLIHRISDKDSEGNSTSLTADVQERTSTER